MLINKKIYVLFLVTFVLLITNTNVYSKNTYLKYSPSEVALSYTGNSVIMICDKPSSIGLTFFEMKGKLKISSHKLYDKLLKEFHPTLNGELKLTDFSSGSNKKVWWKCNKADDHEWKSTINNRVNGNKCPCCRGLKVVLSNCLATTHNHIAKQWDYTKNFPLTPFDVISGGHKKYWWKCDLSNDHEWESTTYDRISGHGCPCCSGNKIVVSNCLATTHPNIAIQWHPTKNKLTPFDVMAKSNKKVWWKCDKSYDHEWESVISNKINQGCPCCSGKKVVISNCLSTTHYEISKKWHSTKNFPLTTFDVTFGSGKKVWWKCNNNHEWITSVCDLVRGINDGGNGCPLCYESNGERKIKNILEQINLVYETQKIFDDCKHEKKLRFDFYLPKYNILIEYDGIQHFKPIIYWGGIKKFNNDKKRDKAKNEYAMKNNIPLLRIPYTKFDLIEEEIKQFLEKIKV